MLKNYFKIAFRGLWKNPGYSFVNIGGLALGMGVAMLIGLWVYDELSFNRHHKNYGRIAQVMQSQVIHGEKKVSSSVPFPFVNELKTNYSGHFTNIVAATHVDTYVLAAGENKLSRKGQFVEAAAPAMFSLEMLAGSWESLGEMQSVLLSESTAAALFAKKNPINEIVKIDTDKTVRVTGIYRDFPQNSQFHDVQFLSTWDYFLSINTYMSKKRWDNHALWMYVEIKPETTFEKASAAIRDSELNAIRHLDNMQEEVATNPQMWLHPMRDWHLYSHFVNGAPDQGAVRYVTLIAAIGFFVLLLACINFINMSTARADKRAKEVGIRKAIGSFRGQLVAQFLGESFLIVFIAGLIATVLLVVSLDWFNNLAAKNMSVPWLNAYFWLSGIGFIFITGTLAGVYPAFYLTAFQPVKVLKGAAVRLGRFSSLPRQILVTTQFTVSITLVICTLIVYKQIQYAKNRPVGYARNGLMMVAMRNGDFYDKADLIRTKLKGTGAVSEVAVSQSPATGVWSQNTGFTWEENDRGTDNFATLTVSPEYAKTVNWEFLAGRNFSKDFASDSTGFVINETAARLMGFPKEKISEAIGKRISWKSKWMTNDIRKQFTVLGVVKDMVMESPFEKVSPTVFFTFGSPNWFNIRINPQVSTSTAISRISQVFTETVPTAPFEYEFADEAYGAKFRTEERVGKLSGFFSCLAILISCLGLFGLASFVAEQRTKEIGIRKVLGASVAGLWRLLSGDFVILAMIAAAISIPVASFAMHGWLSGYDYRTEISWWIYVVAVIGALTITLLTVSFQTIRAALINPVKTLKSE